MGPLLCQKAGKGSPHSESECSTVRTLLLRWSYVVTERHTDSVTPQTSSEVETEIIKNCREPSQVLRLGTSLTQKPGRSIRFDYVIECEIGNF